MAATNDVHPIFTFNHLVYKLSQQIFDISAWKWLKWRLHYQNSWAQTDLLVPSQFLVSLLLQCTDVISADKVYSSTANTSLSVFDNHFSGIIANNVCILADISISEFFNPNFCLPNISIVIGLSIGQDLQNILQFISTELMG